MSAKVALKVALPPMWMSSEVASPRIFGVQRWHLQGFSEEFPRIPEFSKNSLGFSSNFPKISRICYKIRPKLQPRNLQSARKNKLGNSSELFFLMALKMASGLKVAWSRVALLMAVEVASSRISQGFSENFPRIAKWSCAAFVCGRSRCIQVELYREAPMYKRDTIRLLLS